MPVYEFKCVACGAVFDLEMASSHIHAISESDKKVRCVRCQRKQAEWKPQIGLVLKYTKKRFLNKLDEQEKKAGLYGKVPENVVQRGW